MDQKLSNSRREILSKAWIFSAGMVSAGVWKTAEAAKKKFKKRGKNNVPLGSWNTIVKEVEISDWPKVDKEFLLRICNHCEGDEKIGVPPCVKICPKYPDVPYRPMD